MEEINAVIDPITGEKKEYRYLMKDSHTKGIWDHAMATELD